MDFTPRRCPLSTDQVTDRRLNALSVHLCDRINIGRTDWDSLVYKHTQGGGNPGRLLALGQQAKETGMSFVARLRNWYLTGRRSLTFHGPALL